MQVVPVRVLGLLALAFGFLEAAVVVYLRALLDPTGARFPLVQLPDPLLRLEMAREAATLVLLVAAAMLAARGVVSRLAAFCLAFGIWDLAYYAALRIVLHWPRSLADWDLLFLLPVPWVGPVYALVIVSLTLVVAGGLTLHHEAHHGRFVAAPATFAVVALGAAAIFVSFVMPSSALRRGALPERYPVALFALGEIAGVAAFAAAWRRNRARGNEGITSAAPRPPQPLPVAVRPTRAAAFSSAGAPTSTATDPASPPPPGER